jgi:outer membrane lipoprotein LolB
MPSASKSAEHPLLNLFRYATLTLVCLLLGACATSPRITRTSEGAANGDVDTWQAQGRIAVAAGKSGGSGSFNWQQQREHSFIQLAGPAGVGALRLTVDGDALQVETGDGKTLQSAAAVNELEQRLGAKIPTSKLRFWIRGRPAPGDYHWIDETGATPVLEQDGWRIEYQQFMTSGDQRLPVKFSALAGEARLRVLVDTWHLGS